MKGSSIESVRPIGSGTAQAGAVVLNGKGKYLIPGLVDAHVHFPQRDFRTGAELALLYLANGVTSVYCMHGSSAILALRSAIAAHSLLGPTIHSTSPIQNDPALTFARARRRVKRYRALGYDSIKVYNDLSREGFEGICHEAERQQLPVVGHIVRSIGARETMRSYQSAVVHSEEFVYTEFDYNLRSRKDAEDSKLRRGDLPRLAELFARRHLVLITTLQCNKSIIGQFEDINSWCERPEMQYLPQRIRLKWSPANNFYAQQKYVAERLHRAFEFQQELVRVFHLGGATVLAGTDALAPGVVPGFTLREEIDRLVESGLSIRSALAAATQATARLVADDRVGRIEPGCWADLVLLPSDPTTNLGALASAEGVMARGQWLSSQYIQETLAQARGDAR